MNSSQRSCQSSVAKGSSRHSSARSKTSSTRECSVATTSSSSTKRKASYRDRSPTYASDNIQQHQRLPGSVGQSRKAPHCSSSLSQVIQSTSDGIQSTYDGIQSTSQCFPVTKQERALPPTSKRYPVVYKASPTIASPTVSEKGPSSANDTSCSSATLIPSMDVQSTSKAFPFNENDIARSTSKILPSRALECSAPFSPSYSLLENSSSPNRPETPRTSSNEAFPPHRNDTKTQGVSPSQRFRQESEASSARKLTRGCTVNSDDVLIMDEACIRMGEDRYSNSAGRDAKSGVRDIKSTGREAFGCKELRKQQQQQQQKQEVEVEDNRKSPPDQPPTAAGSGYRSVKDNMFENTYGGIDAITMDQCNDDIGDIEDDERIARDATQVRGMKVNWSCNW